MPKTITYSQTVAFCCAGQMGVETTRTEPTDDADGTRFVTRYWKCPRCNATEKTVDIVPAAPAVRFRSKAPRKTPHKRH